MLEWIQHNAYWLGMAMMPLTYGFAGWFTNLMALRMTFYPLKFIGIPPYLGWQGIVPRKASGLALKSVNMLSERLVKIDEFFVRIKPQLIQEQFAPIVENNIPEITNHMIESLDEHLCHLADENIAKQIQQKAVRQSIQKIDEIANHLSQDAKKVFNFKALVLRSLTGNNVKLIVDIFQEVGEKEFKFIMKSGWHFGATLGTLQVLFWYFFPFWYTLPIQGMIVGYVTNWLALFMIFRPLREKKFLGIRYQGMFLKRQDQVSQKYAEIFALHVLSGRNIMEEILYRRVARSVVETIEEDIIEALKQKCENNSHLQKDVENETAKVRKQAAEKMIDSLSESSRSIEKIMERSMNVKSMIYSRMKELPPEEFEPILRSAFQEDEYILIILGSVFGGLIGLLQALYMLYI